MKFALTPFIQGEALPRGMKEEESGRGVMVPAASTMLPTTLSMGSSGRGKGDFAFHNNFVIAGADGAFQ